MPSGFALQVGCPSGCQGSNLGVPPRSPSTFPLHLHTLSLLALYANLTLSPQLQLFPCPWNFSPNSKSCSDSPNEKADTRCLPSISLSLLLAFLTCFFSQTKVLVCKKLRPAPAINHFALWALTHSCPRCFDQPCSAHTPSMLHVLRLVGAGFKGEEH